MSRSRLQLKLRRRKLQLLTRRSDHRGDLGAHGRTVGEQRSEPRDPSVLFVELGSMGWAFGGIREEDPLLAGARSFFIRPSGNGATPVVPVALDDRVSAIAGAGRSRRV